MKQIGENALVVAKHLESHPKVEKVYYPGLESHKYYEVHKKQAKTGAGVISFVIKGGTSSISWSFLQHLKIILVAVSIGGVESLAQWPALITHSSIPRHKREELGIVDGLIRLSVGIEDVNDLIGDLNQAFDAIKDLP